MSLLAQVDRWSLRVSDALDPMLVRCVRQDLRSKVFVGVFSLLLLISAAAALIFASQAGSTLENDVPYGKYLFVVLGWCWSFALIVVQASATHRLVAQERNDDTWDLVELTGLPPQRIVRGLLAASLTQSALYTAAMAPFLVMAYLLRGLDLLTIVAALIVVPMMGVLAASGSLFLACSAPSKKARMAGGGLVGLLMLIAWISTSSWQFSNYDRGFGQFFSDLLALQGTTWMVAGMLFTAWASLLWLCLVFSATLLTHRAGDRSSRPRGAVAVVWGVVLLWLAGIMLFADQTATQHSYLLVAVGSCGVALTVVAGFFALTEDYALSPRQAQVIASAHGWRRSAAVILGSGAARGRWYTIALAVSATALLILAYAINESEHSAVVMAWCALGNGLQILVVGDFVARRVVGHWCSTPLHRRMAIMAVLSAWSIIPALAAQVMADDAVVYALLRALTPGWGIYHHAIEDTSDGMSGLGGVLMLMPLVMLAIIAIQARRMTVVTRRVVAETGDRNARA